MSLSKMNNVEKSLTKKEYTNEEMAIMLAPRLNWVEQICPAPMAVNSMGQIALLSCNVNDFELTKTESGYKYLRYSSFKPNLMQVLNASHNAFQRAHVNMGAIRDETHRLPGSMQQAVKILVNGNKIHMEKFLPKTLDSIKSIAEDCQNHAEKVMLEFLATQNMISELMEVSLATSASTQEEREKLEIEKVQNEEFQQMLGERKKHQQEEKKRISKQLEERIRTYDKAFQAMPGAWDTIGMNIVSGLSGLILGTAEKFLGSGKENKTGKHNSTTSNGTAEGNAHTKVAETLSQNDLDLLNVFVQMRDKIVNLMGNMEVQNKDGSKEKNNDSKIFTGFTTVIDGEINMHLTHASEELQAKVKPIQHKVTSTVENLKKTWVNYPVDQALKELDGLLLEIVPLGSQYKAAIGYKAMSPQTPHASTAAANSNEDETGCQAAIKNAQFKVTEANEMLKRTEENYDHLNEKLLTTNDKLNEAMQRMSKIDASTMKYNEILKFLKQGLRSLGELKEQWSKLTTFFAEMVKLIEISMNKPMDLFVEYANSTKETGLPMDKLMCDLIYDTTRQAVGYGFVINRMASGYHEISTNHLEGPMSTLAGLMTLDKDDDKKKIMQLKEQLHNQCIEAQDSIKKKQQEEHAKFKSYMDKRMKVIEESFREITSQLPQVVKKEIENQVKKGMADVPEQKPDISVNPVADEW